jgi:type I restriction enzyme, R subunit
MYDSDYSEDALIEQPAIELFQELGWQTANCFYEVCGGSRSTLGRETRSEVALTRRLRRALEDLNPDMPAETISTAVEELTRDRSAMSPAAANRDIYNLLREGVRVTIRTGDEETQERVRVINWEEPAKNDFFLASQFWVSGEMHTRRPDLIGFVNGLPLVFVELKATTRRLEDAYNDNLTDYRDTVPHLFWHNALIILSTGDESRVGSMTAEWDHFGEWKKINDEGEEGIVSLETVIRGTCAKDKLLDLVENFTLYKIDRGGLIKILAKNHQYLGVNRALANVERIRESSGRLGVFWHTQGAGKSFSMIFFAQKVLRKLPGNWTFVIVTDRDDLDEQIFKNFADTGAVTQNQREVQAQSGPHLKELLQANHRYVFTLIQKFRTERGERYEKLSDSPDIIVMTDEAHRSQYDIYALNMRNALPKASFIGFTGTPLIAGEEERTREVFGDYISLYDFKQSIQDKATVPLYYENRIPELELVNEAFNEQMEEVLEEAMLDTEQEKKLEREFSREYHLITRDDRLEKIADDIVTHFMTRGQLLKAMVVSIDKATAVRMYDKVRYYWDRYLENLRAELTSAEDEDERERLTKRIRYMEETDMAVVISQSQNEIKEFQDKGLDIRPHRWRMTHEDLDTKFKDPKDPFRIVFVCAMWMTGFDVPSCSTIYLDKPMRNHTLMQTIARANRVWKDKLNGLIVDYIGVFRDLQKALSIYAQAPRPGAPGGEMPVEKKTALIEPLRTAIKEATDFCIVQGVNAEAIKAAVKFERVKLLNDAREALIANDESKRKFLSLADQVVRRHKALLPHETANEALPDRALFEALADKIRALAKEADISGVMGAVEALLDESITADGYIIREPAEAPLDLSQIDFQSLRARFREGRQRTEAERLRGAINTKLKRMVRLNKSRANYTEKFQKMIDEYNSGATNVEFFFENLLQFTRELEEEEKRTIAEQLTEEELAIFDILTRPELPLNKSEEKEVKKVARSLLETLEREKLVLDWRKKQQARASVKQTIEVTLDGLPDAYGQELYEIKCDAVYQHVYDSYFGPDRSIYSAAL